MISIILSFLFAEIKNSPANYTLRVLTTAESTGVDEVGSCKLIGTLIREVCSGAGPICCPAEAEKRPSPRFLQVCDSAEVAGSRTTLQKP